MLCILRTRQTAGLYQAQAIQVASGDVLRLDRSHLSPDTQWVQANRCSTGVPPQVERTGRKQRATISHRGGLPLTKTLALMPEQFEDVSRWPLGRYFREVVASQPDGRLLLLAGKINWCVGSLSALILLFVPIFQRLTWLHVGLFFCMPLIGFMWFIRDMPSPQFTAYEHVLRKPWQRGIDTLFQLIPALLPWVVLVEAYVR